MRGCFLHTAEESRAFRPQAETERGKRMQYTVERHQDGRWVPKASYQCEERAVFESVAAVTEYRYRIMLDGKDVTAAYRRAGALKKGRR